MGAAPRSPGRRPRAVVALLFVSALGCGDDDASTMDGATPETDGGEGGGAVIPWLEVGGPPIAPPALVPCPMGWRQVDEADGPSNCEPYPEGGPADCPEGEAHFPGEPACAPVGSACPSGDFPDDLPADRAIIYVLEGAMGGDGSVDRPYGTATEFAMGGLSRGTIIALGVGTYDEPLRLRAGLVLRGVCAGQTRIAVPDASTMEAVITPAGTDVTVQDLTVGPSPRTGFIVISGNSLTLEGVIIEETQGMGIIVAETGSAVTAHSLVVRDTAERPDGNFGRGLDVEAGGTATVSRAIFERNREIAAYALGEGTRVELEDTVLRDTRSHALFRIAGHGLVVERGGAARLTRGLVERNLEIGVVSNYPGSSVDLEQVIVRNNQSRESDGELGRGMTVQEGATATIAGALFDGNQEFGLGASLAGTTLTAADLVVRDSRAVTADGRYGRGLNLFAGVEATFDRTVVQRCRELGVFMAGSDTRVDFEDLVVMDTQSAMDGTGGMGLNVQAGANATVTRALFERNRRLGIQVSEPGANLVASDCVVRDTRGQALDDFGGRGMTIELDADAALDRTLFERNAEAGISVGIDGATLQADHLIVSETRARCTDSACESMSFGTGVVAFDSGAATVRSFEVRDSRLCGVQVATGSSLDLMDGLITRSTIGACVQVDGYDLDRLTAGVRFADNGVNLEATTLPVPEAAYLGFD